MSEHDITHGSDGRDFDGRDKDATIAYQDARIAVLTERVRQLEEEIQRLKGE